MHRAAAAGASDERRAMGTPAFAFGFRKLRLGKPAEETIAYLEKDPHRQNLITIV
jgi:hypothetical protein